MHFHLLDISSFTDVHVWCMSLIVLMFRIFCFLIYGAFCRSTGKIETWIFRLVPSFIKVVTVNITMYTTTGMFYRHSMIFPPCHDTTQLCLTWVHDAKQNISLCLALGPCAPGLHLKRDLPTFSVAKHKYSKTCHVEIIFRLIYRDPIASVIRRHLYNLRSHVKFHGPVKAETPATAATRFHGWTPLVPVRITNRD